MASQSLSDGLTWSSIRSSSAPSCGSGSLAYMTLTVIGTLPVVGIWGSNTQLQSWVPRKVSGKPSFAMNPLEVTLVEEVQRSSGFSWTTIEIHKKWLGSIMHAWKFSLKIVMCACNLQCMLCWSLCNWVSASYLYLTWLYQLKINLNTWQTKIKLNT